MRWCGCGGVWWGHQRGREVRPRTATGARNRCSGQRVHPDPCVCVGGRRAAPPEYAAPHVDRHTRLRPSCVANSRRTSSGTYSGPSVGSECVHSSTQSRRGLEQHTQARAHPAHASPRYSSPSLKFRHAILTPTRSPFPDAISRDVKISNIRPRLPERKVLTRPHSPVPQTMYWSQTESSKWSSNYLLDHLGHPFRVALLCPWRFFLTPSSLFSTPLQSSVVSAYRQRKRDPLSPGKMRERRCPSRP